MTTSAVVNGFVGRINAHDAVGLVALMAADHIFVDSLGNKFSRPAIEEGWRQYFAMVPDYWIRVDRTIIDGRTSVLIGAAGGTYVPKGAGPRPENRWETPAVWVVEVHGDKVAEWRIYSDNEPIRSRMNATRAA